MLKRREVPTLAELTRQDAGDDSKPRHKPFKDYEPGYMHIDIKHLPQMPDEDQKRYLYVAIDRARGNLAMARLAMARAGARLEIDA